MTNSAKTFPTLQQLALFCSGLAHYISTHLTARHTIEVAGGERRLDGPGGDLDASIASSRAWTLGSISCGAAASDVATDAIAESTGRIAASPAEAVGIADVSGDFFALHHPLTALGEQIFLPWLDREASTSSAA